MVNVHHIYLDVDNAKKRILKNHGFQVDEGYSNLTLEENEVFWSLKPYFDKWDIKDLVITRFSDDDLNNATYLRWLPAWQPLYPEPAETGGWRNQTYDTSSYLPECGIGLIQKAPFRIKQKPAWGKRKMFVLYWVFDEIFCRKDLYEDLFKKYNIEYKPVLLYANDMIIEDTVQLILPESNAPLELAGYPYQLCGNGQAKRYDLINRDFFPNFSGKISNHLKMFKSQEFFGTGAEGRRYIFITQELRKELIAAKVDSRYYPVRNELIAS